MNWLFRLLCALLLGLTLAPRPAGAQTSDWQERRTDHFAILYTDADAATAESYAQFVDSIYDEVSAIFGHTTSTPLTLRLYASQERYLADNPLARNLPGVVAHADYRLHQVVVVVPQTSSQTPDEIQNNIRHELTHIVASELSSDRLNVNFQEGLAQYVEHPSRELEAKLELLRRALTSDKLMRWSDLDSRDIFYRTPDISYPQSLSIVSFLVERFTFAKVREFVEISGRSSGYRSALERAFGESAETLETEWRAWLPDYVAGGYRAHSLTGYDLSRADELLRRGRYTEAQQELDQAITWLTKQNKADELRQAEALRDRAAAGLRAEGAAQQARAAIEAADFVRAGALVTQARQTYATLGDTRQDEVLAEYAARADRGRRAEEALRQARELAGGLRYPQARMLADRAVVEFVQLGASRRASEARALRQFMDQRQSLLGGGLLLLGVGGVLLSTLRRLFVREAEAW